MLNHLDQCHRGYRDNWQEIEILRTLYHANIVRLLEVLQTKNAHYLVLELAEGGSLVTYLYEKQVTIVTITDDTVSAFLSLLIQRSILCYLLLGVYSHYAHSLTKQYARKQR